MRVTHLLFGLGLAAGTAVQAANWTFLEYAPVNYFTDQDFALLKETAEAALDKAPDGDTRGWSSPETGAFGTIQPLSSYEKDGTPCRRVEIFNSAGGATGTSRFDFCKQPDGEWKTVSRRPSAKGQ